MFKLANIFGITHVTVNVDQMFAERVSLVLTASELIHVVSDLSNCLRCVIESLSHDHTHIVHLIG